MAKDKVIKSGQFTLRRILFLVVAGGIIVGTVAMGGLWLNIGYWLITLSLVVLLLLVGYDYGVNFEKVEAQPQQSQTMTAIEPTAVSQTVSEARVRRRSSRQVKRRR
jgi:predicted exporter